MSQEIDSELVQMYTEKLSVVVEGILGLIEMEEFNTGDHYGLEQLLDDPELWPDLPESEKNAILTAAQAVLGVNLLEIDREHIFYSYEEKGVPGTKTEEGGMAYLLHTTNPALEIRVVEYKNPKAGKRYDIGKTN